MYKLSALEAEDISFALVKGATHPCAHCGQMYPEGQLQDVWSRGKGFYGDPYSFRAPVCNTCVDFLLSVEGSVKKDEVKLHYKSIEEMEDLFFLSEGGVAHNA